MLGLRPIRCRRLNEREKTGKRERSVVGGAKKRESFLVEGSSVISRLREKPLKEPYLPMKSRGRNRQGNFPNIIPNPETY